MNQKEIKLILKLWKLYAGKVRDEVLDMKSYTNEGDLFDTHLLKVAHLAKKQKKKYK